MTTDPQVDGASRTVVVLREYPDPIGDVWAALTRSDRLARWLGHYTGAGGQGGTVEFTLTGEVDAGGEVAAPVTATILECDPPRRLVVDLPESDDRVWRVAATLTAEAGRTVLRFEQEVVDGLDPGDVEAGWSWYLDRLGASLSGGPMPAWADYLPGRSGGDRSGGDGVEHHVTSVRRQVGTRVPEPGEARVVTLSRTFDVPVDEVWEACTDAGRIPRWFLPVTGELRPGGRFQLEGNAGGTVERCDPPRSFAATWEFGDQLSTIAVELAPEPGGGTLLTLEHVVPVDDHWRRFGPGAVGIGWELALLGLAGHLGAPGVPTPDEGPAWMASDAGRAFVTRSAAGWSAAHVAGGGDPVVARESADRTVAAYTGDAEPQPAPDAAPGD
ncbi:MAG TPA: SRPBCC domain-containing protein [Pseudonocardia sp.]|jgi:uncharacterized protein YndB with AHSA1/START domain